MNNIFLEATKKLPKYLQEALNNPLVIRAKDGTRHVVGIDELGIDGAMALLDPSLYQYPEQEVPFDALKANGLTVENNQQAALFYQAVEEFLKLIFGHTNLAITTFRECIIASSGAILVDDDLNTYWIKKKQFFIQMGKTGEVVGKPGSFILPEQRLTPAEHAIKVVNKFMGLELDTSRLRQWGADIEIPKVDYPTTFRNRNYGIIFNYVVRVTPEEVIALRNNEKVVHGKLDTLEKLEDDGILSLEAEMPYIRKLYETGFKGFAGF